MCTLQETICRFAELHSRLSDADGLGPASRRPAVSRPGGLPVRRFARSFVPSTSIWRIRTGRLSAPMFYRRRYWSAGLLREAPRRFPETGPAPADPRVRLPSRWRALRTARPWSSRRLSSLTAIGRRRPFRGVGSPPLGQMNFDCSSWKSVGGLSTPTCLKGRRASQLVGTKGFYGPQRQFGWSAADWPSASSGPPSGRVSRSRAYPTPARGSARDARARAGRPEARTRVLRADRAGALPVSRDRPTDLPSSGREAFQP